MGDDITIGVTEIVNNIEVTAQPNDQIIDISVVDNSDEVTLNITPTVVEVNINKGSSYARWGTIYGNLTDQLDLSNALLLKADLVDGKVPAYQLPSFVDDVIEVANYAALPTIGEIGKIYVTLDNNKIYRWGGSVYVEIAANQAIWGSITGTLSSQSDLQSALNAKQNALSGTGFVKISGTTISYDNNTYALDNNVVHLTGDETISGRKTFNSSTDIGIRSNNSGNGYGIYSENASNGFGLYVANNGSGKAIKVANALSSFGNIFEGSYNGTTNFYVDYSGKVNAPIFELQANNTIGSAPNYIGQAMATNDAWKIYGNTIASDRGELVFELGDNAESSSTNGQRFRFNYDNTSSGTAKSPFILDYNDATFDTNATFSGSVGIGTTNLSAPLSIGRVNSAEEGGQIDLCRASDNASAWAIDVFGSTSTPSLRFIDNIGSATRMTITSGGNVGIGTTSPSVALEVIGGVRGSGLSISNTLSNQQLYFIKSGSLRYAFGTEVGAASTNDLAIYNYIAGGTSFIIYGNNNYQFFGSNVSDKRAKEKIVDLDFDATEKVMALQPKSYYMKNDSKQIRYGLIAQEVNEVLPDLVCGDIEGDDFVGLDYNGVIPVLIKAIQELKAEIELLKAK